MLTNWQSIRAAWYASEIHLSIVQVRSGKAVLMVDSNGDVRRAVAVVAVHISNDDGTQPALQVRTPESTRKGCNGRALDRVTKQKHRPNRQKLSKKCPKIVFTALWTIFGHF